MKPTIGRIVIYKSKIDNGPGNDVLSPAIVIRTREATVPAVINRWGPATYMGAVDGDIVAVLEKPTAVVNELPDDDTIDLVVFGLGQTYREYAVSKGSGFGQWSWPERT